MKTLPTINYPVYTFEIPSNKESKRFRPFTVRESKNLLIAQGTENEISMLDTLKSVLESACLDDIDVESLCSFDLEYLLIKLRAISVSEKTALLFYCSDEHGGDKESRKMQITVNLDNVEIVNLDKFSPDIQLDDNLYCKMRYPTLETLRDLTEIVNGDLNATTQIIATLIETIATKDEIYDTKDFSTSELKSWLDGLTETQFAKIQEFVVNIPYCRIKVQWKCPHCGKQNTQFLSGIFDFF